MSLTSESVEAQLLHVQFQNMFVRRGQNTPARTGMHASAVLQPESEWCLREQVLLALHPDKVEKPHVYGWQWKREAIFSVGWALHELWQKHFLESGLALFTDGTPELDKTHYDDVRNLYFSPDAILEWGKSLYIVEMKFINHEAFAGRPATYDVQGNLLKEAQAGLTDDLLESAAACETVAKARMQCNLYMHLTSIPQGIILVGDKNNQDFRLYLMEYDRELVQPYLDRIYEVKKFVALSRQDKSRVPARRCASASDSRAVRCPLRRVCFGVEKES